MLVDPESMARTMPGIESFDVLDERHWTASVKIPLGLTGLRMKVSFEKVEEREPEFSKLVAQGHGLGSVLRMETSFELREDGSRTQMRWTAEVSLRGPLGGLGSRALRPLVDRQVRNVLEVIEQQLEPIEFAADLDLKVTSNNKVFRAPPARDTSRGRFLWLMCSRRSGLLSARWLFRDTLVGLLPHAAATRSRTTSLRIL